MKMAISMHGAWRQNGFYKQRSVNRFVAIAILKIDWLFSQRFGHDIGLVKPAAEVDIGAAF